MSIILKKIVFKTKDARFRYHKELTPSEQVGLDEILRLYTQPQIGAYTEHHDKYKLEVEFEVVEITENTIVVDNIKTNIIYR